MTSYRKRSKTKNQKILSMLFLLTIIASMFIIELTVAENITDPVETIKESIVDEIGNVYFTGETQGNDVYIVKYSSTGEMLWDEIFGGSGNDIMEGIGIDNEGNILVLGTTRSDDLPVKNAVQPVFGGYIDVFVAKWHANGTLLWRTYLGGSDKEFIIPFTIDFNFDADNNLIVYGLTESDNFPLLNPIQSEFSGLSENLNQFRGDFFITKITSNGQLMWSTYFGGSGMELGDLVLDFDDNVIIYGSTSSENFPLKNQIQDQYGGGTRDTCLVKISPQGELLWSTYLGGNDEDSAVDVFIDSGNNIKLVGVTKSSNYPHVTTLAQHQGDYDITVSQINPNGELMWGTIYGGSGSEVAANTAAWVTGGGTGHEAWAHSALDSEENIVIYSRTSSTDVVLLNEYDNQPHGVEYEYKPLIAKINPNGETVFLSYSGSSDSSYEYLNIDGWDNIVITGMSPANDLETKNAFSTSNSGETDNFVSRILPNGTLLHSTYLGGSSQENLFVSILDIEGNSILIGQTNSEDFPVTDDTNTLGGDFDVYISKITPTGELSWSILVGSDGEESANSYSVVGLPNGSVIILMYSESSTLFGEKTNGKNSFIVGYDENGDQYLSSLLNPISGNRDDNQNERIIDFLILLSILAASGISYYFIMKYLRLRQMREVFMNSHVKEILSPIFNNYPNMIFFLNGTLNPDDKELTKELKDQIPDKIFEFQYLLNPVRLSIIKLLSEYPELTTIQLKDALDLSWTKINHNLQSLKNNGAIETEQRFEDGNLKIFVSANPSTLTRYHELKETMTEFFDSSDKFEKFIGLIKSSKHDLNNNLYPTD